MAWLPDDWGQAVKVAKRTATNEVTNDRRFRCVSPDEIASLYKHGSLTVILFKNKTSRYRKRLVKL